VRAPVLFFDQNPTGRIINRFAKDVGSTDDNLPMTLYDFIQCLLMVLAAVLVVCSGCPYIFIALIPLIWYFSTLRAYFLKTSREVKRLEAISRSPIFSQLNESLEGLVTLRAYRLIPLSTEKNKELINENARAYFAFISSSRWLGYVRPINRYRYYIL
jgi:ABC-type multidrug transport system fused ATPase/permease subunit